MNQYFESLIFEPKQRLLRVLLFDETVRASNCVCCNRVTVMQYAKLSRDCGQGTVRELMAGSRWRREIQCMGYLMPRILME